MNMQSKYSFSTKKAFYSNILSMTFIKMQICEFKRIKKSEIFVVLVKLIYIC